MKHLGKINAQKGFTLLELLIAITLITIGLLATATMQSVAMNSNSIANRSTVATAIAQEVMEEVMSRDILHDPIFRVATATVWPTYDLTPDELLTNDRNIPSAGTYRAIVATDRPSPNINVTRVTVTVLRINEATGTPYGRSDSALSGIHGIDPAAAGAFTLTSRIHF